MDANAPSTSGSTANIDWSDPSLYINRELSWLEFNHRCLLEAFNNDLPLLERVRFLAIFSNNLDEFFMVRVSGLKDQVTAGVFDTTPDMLTPQQQLSLVRERVMPMLVEQRKCFHEQIIPKLAEVGVHVHSYSQLPDAQKEALRRYFEMEMYPVLTPLAVDPGRPFPHISNLSLNLAIVMTDEQGKERFARVKVPTAVLPRLIPLNDVLRNYMPTTPAAELTGHRFVWLEEVITANLDILFPGMEIVASAIFRITRNNDIEIAEEEADDLLETVEENVRDRRFGQVVRMTVMGDMPESIRQVLLENLEITWDDIYPLPAPIGMSDLFALANIEMPTLKWPPYIARRAPEFQLGEDIFTSIRRQDILIHRPYDSFQNTVEFFQQAADDPNVLAIKSTLYRVGSNSPIVQALLRAQENGKQVAVLVELKARFDEQNNINWARALEDQGVHVVYGLVGLKTHSKVALVVRREADGIRRYVHLSTGNYNASTARIYTDICLFTVRQDIAADASDLFNRLTGYSARTKYRKLFVAPEHLRGQIEGLIKRETEHAKQGRGGHMIFKMNSLVDRTMIQLLYQASMAGVQVDLLIRGICCLRPGIPGVSENIRVRSLIGRYLEHARVFYFRNGGSEEVYSGSADLMPRNLNNRVEVLFPIEAAAARGRIIDEILTIEMCDNVKARELLNDGSYRKIEASDGENRIDAQRWFMERNRDQS
ncbi:MAG: polyphosphate kinase 1 [Anaerolineae bacterium]|nr:polyphosphate kinase 1 [Anaerolineae bacterium]